MMITIFDVIRDGDFVVLDTETTGLNGQAEICQIAIINAMGETLLDTLVKPVNGIPADATAIHGITNEMVASAQMFDVVVADIEQAIRGRHVLVYNATYDRGMLHKSADAHGIGKIDWKTFSTWWCVMTTFAEIYGEWNEYHGNYKWKPLYVAARHYDIPQMEPAHTALADCLTTLEVARRMAFEVQP